MASSLALAMTFVDETVVGVLPTIRDDLGISVALSHVQDALGLSPSAAGLAMLPTVVLAPATGAPARRFGARTLTVAGGGAERSASP
ncbi:hypothetical protein [Streptomyces sp. NPDC002889]|uniref:hypothetical protein n=1 Tax=Streptomyces sp. NPDC002889 TaxID=3364669 RepID=UPI0036B9A99C